MNVFYVMSAMIAVGPSEISLTVPKKMYRNGPTNAE